MERWKRAAPEASVEKYILKKRSDLRTRRYAKNKNEEVKKNDISSTYGRMRLAIWAGRL